MAEEEKAAEAPAADGAAEAEAGGGNAIPEGCKPMFVQMAKYEE